MNYIYIFKNSSRIPDNYYKAHEVNDWRGRLSA